MAIPSMATGSGSQTLQAAFQYIFQDLDVVIEWWFGLPLKQQLIPTGKLT
jgi:hypothetical protein